LKRFVLLLCGLPTGKTFWSHLEERESAPLIYLPPLLGEMTLVSDAPSEYRKLLQA